MPRRATKRGDERTPLDRDCDVLICGASFGGLAVARELATSGATVLVVDRYEIGERQTSACGIPTMWLDALGLQGSRQQTFSELVIHTPHATARFDLPWSFSTFDYRALCNLLAAQGKFEFETATILGVDREFGASRTPDGFAARRIHGVDREFGASRTPNGFAARRIHGVDREFGASRTPNGFAARRIHGVDREFGASRTPNGFAARRIHTDRGDIRAPLVVDALGWRRVLGGGEPIQPPEAFLSRGLEVHPFGGGDDLEVWIDRSYVPAGYGWSFPADGEVRVGVGSFDPRFHVKEPTVRLAEDLHRDAVRYQGNWIPHKIREATADGIFYVGDSAGHCLPLTAEGIRTALYFGLACGRELNAVIAGSQRRDQAIARYGAFSARHAWKFESLLRVQRLIPRIAPRLLSGGLRTMQSQRFVDWSFNHYLEIAHPRFVATGARGGRQRRALTARA